MNFTEEEFKKAINKAQVKAAENLNNDFMEATKDKKDTAMPLLAYNLQNIMAMAEFRKCIFKELNILNEEREN